MDMGGAVAVAAGVEGPATAGEACHHLGMKALACPLRQHTTTTAASANPAPLLLLFPFLDAMLSFPPSLSLSLFAAGRFETCALALTSVCDLAEGA